MDYTKLCWSVTDFQEGAKKKKMEIESEEREGKAW